MKALAVALAMLAGCASTPARVPAVRFANAPPVEMVDDRRDVPKRPVARPFVRFLFHLDGQVRKPLLRLLELPTPRRALGVNSIDEVPDSTWFTNRIGVRDVTPDEIGAAPGGVGSPEDYRPWTIESSKVGGVSVGFIIRDTRGQRWLVKFDRHGFPEMETAAHVIVGKLLWAAGYNVTEDYVVYLGREDLILGEHATTKDVFGNKRRLDIATLERRLAMIEVDGDGRIRALASRMLDGKPLGGHPADGVRDGDPNDRIPHEHRRDLRGLLTVFSWLDHEDVHAGNFLDMWITDPRDPARRYVKHYMIDFGQSLGVMPETSGNPRRSHEYYLDMPGILSALLSFGTAQRSWEGRRDSPLRGVGAFEATTFDPGSWKPTTPTYTPFLNADRFDQFWGAKLVMRFTRDQLRAAVEAGRLSDPAAVDYIVDTLVARQRAIGRHWFARVNPLDGFVIRDGELCFDDLALVYGFAAPTTETRYALTAFDRDGLQVGTVQDLGPGPTGFACTRAQLAPGADGYTIVRVDTQRAPYSGTTYVHIARDPRTAAARVIGIWRP